MPKEALLSVQLSSFTLPIPLPTLMLTQAWHSRFDKAPAHRWIRETLKSCCGEILKARAQLKNARNPQSSLATVPFDHSLADKSAMPLSNSMGSGKTMVVVLSPAIELSVCM